MGQVNVVSALLANGGWSGRKESNPRFDADKRVISKNVQHPLHR